MSTRWTILRQGGRQEYPFTSAQQIVDALADGELEPQDLVRGPNDASFLPLENHSRFSEVIAELETPPPPPEEETHLDMNPLIDVALVLLIFFILTASYASLRRSIELPTEPVADQERPTAIPKLQDLQDRVFKVVVRQENNLVIVRLDNRVIPMNQLETEMTEQVKRFGKPEAFIDIGPGVSWGTETQVIDACRGAEVRKIHWPKPKPNTPGKP
jgi:biopolymer transport protein ExbD